MDGSALLNGSEKDSACRDLPGDGLGTPTELNGLAPGTPVCLPGVRGPYLHSVFCFGSRFWKVVPIPRVTKHHNLWRKQKVRVVTCVEKKIGVGGEGVFSVGQLERNIQAHTLPTWV